MYCKMCKTQIDDDSRFCYKCGEAVNRSGGNATNPSTSDNSYARQKNAYVQGVSTDKTVVEKFLPKNHILLIMAVILVITCSSSVMKVFRAQAERVFEDYYTYDNYSMFQLFNILDNKVTGTGVLLGLFLWIIGILFAISYCISFISKNNKHRFALDVKVSSACFAASVIIPAFFYSSVQFNDLGWVFLALNILNGFVLAGLYKNEEDKENDAVVNEKRVCKSCGSEILVGNRCPSCGRYL